MARGGSFFADTRNLVTPASPRGRDMAPQEAHVLTRAMQEAHAQVEAARRCSHPGACAKWLSPVLGALRRREDGKSVCSARDFADIFDNAVCPAVEILFRRRWAEEDAVPLNRTFKETLAVCVSRLGDGFPNVWWLMCLLMGVDVGHKAMEYEEVETEHTYWDGSRTRTYSRRARHTATFYEQFGRPIRRPTNGQSVYFYPDDVSPVEAAGKALLGRRLAVVRRRGAGEVMGAACNYHAPSGEHLVAYEDGACEWVNLNRIRFRWIDRERWVPSDRHLTESPADVGLRVNVFWPKMRRSYTGFIRDWRDPADSDGPRRGHRVVYDDGDDKWCARARSRDPLLAALTHAARQVRRPRRARAPRLGAGADLCVPRGGRRPGHAPQLLRRGRRPPHPRVLAPNEGARRAFPRGLTRRR